MISTQFHNKTRYKLILITQLYRRKIKDFLSKSESYHYVKETICALHLQECLWHPRKKTTTLLHQTLEQARFGQAGGVHVALAKARLMMYCLRAASQPQKPESWSTGHSFCADVETLQLLSQQSTMCLSTRQSCAVTLRDLRWFLNASALQ